MAQASGSEYRHAVVAAMTDKLHLEENAVALVRGYDDHSSACHDHNSLLHDEEVITVCVCRPSMGRPSPDEYEL
jgi:hypothetical protein